MKKTHSTFAGGLIAELLYFLKIDPYALLFNVRLNVHHYTTHLEPVVFVVAGEWIHGLMLRQLAGGASWERRLTVCRVVSPMNPKRRTTSTISQVLAVRSEQMMRGVSCSLFSGYRYHQLSGKNLDIEVTYASATWWC